MKLQPLQFGNFEGLSNETMKYVVGGLTCATAAGKMTRAGEEVSYSADTRETDDKTGDLIATTYHTKTDKSTAEPCPVEE